MTPTISIRSLHMEYQLWMRELIFYKEEIKIFEHHLEMLLARNNNREFLAEAEHYQNQFILEKEVIDHLKHDLNVSERQLASFVHDLTGMGLASIKMDNHTVLRERMKTFRQIYGQLKHDFRNFESQWM